MEFMDYVKPELFVVAVVLYFLGVAVKKSKILDCRFIPLLNGICGILICTLYVFATEAMKTPKEIAMAAFTSLTQRILVAGLSTYVYQMIKQMKDNKKIEK